MDRAIAILVMWERWKHRNAIVFDRGTPSVEHLMAKIEAEGSAWKMAGIIKGDMSFGVMAEWARARVQLRRVLPWSGLA